MSALRKYFFTGIFVLLPLAVTLWILHILVENVGAPASRLFFGWLPLPENWEFVLKILGVLLVLFLVTLLGLLSNLLLGRIFINYSEKIVRRLPFIRVIYGTVKQIVSTFAEQKKAVFQQTVLVEYPKEGTYAIGFLTGDSKGEIQHKTSRDLINVFVPTTPNPTSGFLLFVPREEVIPLEMSITEGMKAVISGGAVVPAYIPGGAPLRVRNPPAPEDHGQP